MATPGAFAKNLAEILTILPATMVVYDRVLRDAGLLDKGGRGRSATKRTFLDAARLIIATMSTTSPAQAAKSVLSYGNLITDVEFERVYPRDRSITLESLCGSRFLSTHRFEEALSALIERVGHDDYYSFSDYCKRQDFGLSFFRNASQSGPSRFITVKVWRERLTTSIMIGPNEYSYFHETIVNLRDCCKEEQRARKAEYTSLGIKHSGLQTICYISDDELRSTYDALNT